MLTRHFAGGWFGWSMATLIACGGGTSAGTGVPSSPDAGGTSAETDASGASEADASATNGETGAAADADAAALAAACDHRFSATYAGRCSVPPIPADELARARPRFVRWCISVWGLPGIRDAVRYLEACAAATATSSCDETPAACRLDLYGELPAGAPCSARNQCQSAWCLSPASDGGTNVACGTCAPTVPLGQTCDPRNFGAGACIQDTRCEPNGPDASTCQVTPMPAALGQACNPVLCDSGLFCDDTNVCKTFGGQGDPCRSGRECSRSLACLGPTCQPRVAAGGSCTTVVDCADGLACFGSVCTARSWVAPGQPCNSVSLCLVGNCPYVGAEPSGVCPSTVLTDGAACEPADTTKTCDTLAGCLDGRCTLEQARCK